MSFRNIRYDDGRVPNAVIQFLLNILVFNNNSCNAVRPKYLAALNVSKVNNSLPMTTISVA